MIQQGARAMYSFTQNSKKAALEPSHFIEPGRAASTIYSKAHPILHLQPMIGNKAVQQLFAQSKLKASQPGDRYEQEAENVAEHVMLMSSPSQIDHVVKPDRIRLPRAQEPCIECNKEVLQYDNVEENGLSRTKSTLRNSAHLASIQDHQFSDLVSGGRNLPKSVRESFESALGYDFSGVNIHTDAKSAKLAQNAKSKAFVIGNNIIFGKGYYAPESNSGKRLLAHELTHVVQQAGGFEDSIDISRSIDRDHNDLIGYSMKDIYADTSPALGSVNEFISISHLSEPVFQRSYIESLPSLLSGVSNEHSSRIILNPILSYRCIGTGLIGTKEFTYENGRKGSIGLPSGIWNLHLQTDIQYIISTLDLLGTDISELDELNQLDDAQWSQGVDSDWTLEIQANGSCRFIECSPARRAPIQNMDVPIINYLRNHRNYISIIPDDNTQIFLSALSRVNPAFFGQIIVLTDAIVHPDSNVTIDRIGAQQPIPTTSAVLDLHFEGGHLDLSAGASAGIEVVEASGQATIEFQDYSFNIPLNIDIWTFDERSSFMFFLSVIFEQENQTNISTDQQNRFRDQYFEIPEEIRRMWEEEPVGELPVTVEVQGECSISGDDATNRRIGMDRAENLAIIFRQYSGIQPQEMRARSAGREVELGNVEQGTGNTENARGRMAWVFIRPRLNR